MLSCVYIMHSNGFKVQETEMICGRFVFPMPLKQRVKTVAVTLVEERRLIPMSKGKLNSCHGLGSREGPGCHKSSECLLPSSVSKSKHHGNSEEE